MTHRRTAAAIAGAAAASYLINRSGPGSSRGGADGPVPDTAIDDAGGWLRINHAGRPVHLIEGPAAIAGVLGGLIISGLPAGDDHDGDAGPALPATGQHGRRRNRLRRLTGIAIQVLGAGLVGRYDDRHATVQAKGFRGHFRALANGQISSGMIKVGGVGAAALAGRLIAGSTGDQEPAGRRLLDVIIDVGLTAGTANLVNLCDLRPGRAAKMIIAVGIPLPGAGPLIGAAAGVLPGDLAGRTMLGDCGANALGAGIGATVATRLRPARLLTLGAVAALNLASERVSFSAVIDRNPALHAIDQWGRGPSRATDDPGTVTRIDSARHDHVSNDEG